MKLSLVVDRRRAILLGAFIAGPGAAEAIHEAVLAIKTATTLSVLADTIHAFSDRGARDGRPERAA